MRSDLDPENFYLEPNKEFYKMTLNAQANVMLNRIGFSQIDCLVCFSKIKGAGLFIEKPIPSFNINDKSLSWSNKNISLEIQISSAFRNNPLIISGILAHEITHFYFKKKNLGKLFDAKISEENNCDLSSFLLGFGKFVLNSIGETGRNSADAAIKIKHYLPWYYLCYIYETINRIKAISEDISQKNLTNRALSMLYEINRCF